MQRYIALLGGINVGGHRVKMTELAARFGELGFGGVETFIASGNVIFASDEDDATLLTHQIETHLAQALGYAVPTFLRTIQEIAAIAGYEPFRHLPPIEDGHTLSVFFMAGALPDETAAALLALRTSMDEFHVFGREVYWLCRGKTMESLVDWTRRGNRLLPPLTARNITTVRRLAAKYAP
jgi:uncharacterized protein (DUF1697 family)